MLNKVTHESQVATNELFLDLADHICQGRDILTELKYAGSGHCDEKYGVLMDLFIQGFELTVGLTSKVKLNEFAPATPIYSRSDI
jgi:hypothetical protein